MDIGIPRSLSLLPVSKDYTGSVGAEESSLLLQAAASPNLLQDLITSALVLSRKGGNFLHISSYGAMFWTCDQNSTNNTGMF